MWRTSSPRRPTRTSSGKIFLVLLNEPTKTEQGKPCSVFIVRTELGIHPGRAWGERERGIGYSLSRLISAKTETPSKFLFLPFRLSAACRQPEQGEPCSVFISCVRSCFSPKIPPASCGPSSKAPNRNLGACFFHRALLYCDTKTRFLSFGTEMPAKSFIYGRAASGSVNASCRERQDFFVL